MISGENLRGIFVPVINPCDEDDNFLEDKFRANISGLFDAGVHGLYVNGGTGDNFRIQMDERIHSAEIAVEIAKNRRRKVIVHVGGPTPRDAVSLAEHAASVGADAVASMPPSYLSAGELREYYRALASASGLSAVVYYFPNYTHVRSTLAELLELLSIPGVVGMKVSDWNIFIVKQLKAEIPDVILYNGFDEMLGLGLMYGCDGGIGTWSNMLPEAYVSIYEAAIREDWSEVLRLQNELSRLFVYINKNGIMAGMKALARGMEIAPACVRAPHDNAGDFTLEQTEEICAIARDIISKTIPRA
ncbi:MAG: dihydrodipicolinate synthase family protein [Synergistaceae bacterium]|jgi:N-acetylneuraminate lyase|nr:dihydrodipicolinate synthase family protein [Synergistaceae bacterium]